MAFSSIEDMIHDANTKNIPIWESILLDDLEESNYSKEESMHKMATLWNTMKQSAAHYDATARSSSGLTGGDGHLMEEYCQKETPLSGDFVGEVIAEALKMGESNACMKRIVAAPTAGACGVLPAVLIPYAKLHHISDDDMMKALYVSAGFGRVIATRASISGAEGGCQAEIGSASAMAAATLVFLRGGTNSMCAHACAMALKNLMGLVCDPVAGLVEVPCVKRNVVGAVNALSSADMALAHITSHIPVDEVIDAMRAVGNSLPCSLRETGDGGLAATPTGIAIKNRLKHK